MTPPTSPPVVCEHSELGVKAAGGVRDLASAQKMISAGADRIGASVGVKIVGESRGESSAATGISWLKALMHLVPSFQIFFRRTISAWAFSTILADFSKIITRTCTDVSLS